jgi:methionyl-tRNA formyltransferase
MRIGIIGNTKLTLKGIEMLISLGHEIVYVFGLPDENLKNKVNGVDLSPFCIAYFNYECQSSIKLHKSLDWDVIINENVDLIISLGDSRFVPEKITNKFKVIGNHGAVLPYVQGGASLVWGRMLNNGEWGVSIMELDKKIDNGTILRTKSFQYKPDITMIDFTEKCDDITVEILKDFMGNMKQIDTHKPSKLDFRVNKHIDSKKGIKLLKFALHNNLNIYLPTRNLEDSKIKKEWDDTFISSFKRANNEPYPKYN